MRTSFQVTNSAAVKRFFKFEADFLDVMITNVGVGIIINNSELFAQRFFPSIVPLDHEKDFCFRVNKSSFLSLLNDGVVEIYIDDFGGAHLTFTGKDTPKREMKFEVQASDMTLIMDKLQIFSRRKDFASEDIKALSPHLTWYKNVSRVLNVIDGVITYESPNLRIYQTVKCTNLCASTQYLRYVLDYTEEHYFFQDFIIGMSTNVVIVLTQQYSNSYCELDLVKKLPESHKIKVALHEVYKLLRMLPKCEDVLLDFEKGRAEITLPREKVSTDLKVLNVASAKSVAKAKTITGEIDLDDLFSEDFSVPTTISTKSEHDMPSLLVPASVLSGVLGAKLEKPVVFSVKKNLVVISLPSKMDIVIGKQVVA